MLFVDPVGGGHDARHARVSRAGRGVADAPGRRTRRRVEVGHARRRDARDGRRKAGCSSTRSSRASSKTSRASATAPLPAVKNTRAASAAAPAPTPRPAPRQDQTGPNGCIAGDERTIRNVGAKFTYLLGATRRRRHRRDSSRPNGDIRHPDGTIERALRSHPGRTARRSFMQPEYQGSKHPASAQRRPVPRRRRRDRRRQVGVAPRATIRRRRPAVVSAPRGSTRRLVHADHA